MHDECDECVHGAECPAAITEDGECHGKWVFKSNAKAPERGGLAVGVDALVDHDCMVGTETENDSGEFLGHKCIEGIMSRCEV